MEWIFFKEGLITSKILKPQTRNPKLASRRDSGPKITKPETRSRPCGDTRSAVLNLRSSNLTTPGKRKIRDLEVLEIYTSVAAFFKKLAEFRQKF